MWAWLGKILAGEFVKAEIEKVKADVIEQVKQEIVKQIEKMKSQGGLK